MKTLFISIFIIFSGYFLHENSSESENSSNVNIETIDVSNFTKTDGNVTYIKINKNVMSYKVTNKNHDNYDFYVNSNYFDVNDNPIGEVRIDGKNISKKNNGGGFFTTNGDTPKFYFDSRPKNVKYSSQTHTPVIINGKLNKKIFNHSWAKSRLPRLIVGENIKGDIIILHTNDNCKLSIYELTFIADKIGVINGMMFDGGASIEVGVKTKDINYHYQIVSDISRKIFKVPTPKIFIVGTLK